MADGGWELAAGSCLPPASCLLLPPVLLLLLLLPLAASHLWLPQVS